jgi:hypothetical protein
VRIVMMSGVMNVENRRAPARVPEYSVLFNTINDQKASAFSQLSLRVTV